ncbi:MAG: hypothetical protein AB1466_04655 [Actinomycetota bacterium]
MLKFLLIPILLILYGTVELTLFIIETGIRFRELEESSNQVPDVGLLDSILKEKLENAHTAIDKFERKIEILSSKKVT